jgi:protein ImuB
MMERILCVWSPNWAVANWKRRNPGAGPVEAFALVQAERGARRLHAVDEQGAALGLFVGQKATDATALVPGLAIADADPAADSAALLALTDWCARFSPAVALDPPDGLFLDITGVTHLWGGEAALAADLRARLARNGIPALAAIAGGPGAAWAMAHFGRAETIVPPGGEASCLAGLPVAALRLAPAKAAQITRLGLATVSALGALPRDQIARRFGQDVVLRLDQALGAAREALSYRRPPTPWFARMSFAEPISAPEDLARVSTDIATRLCSRLEVAGQGGRRFELGFHRLDGVVQSLSIGLALPGRDARAISRLFAPKIETVDPGFGVEVVTLAAEGVQPLGARQTRLDEDREASSEEGVAPLVDRLINRLGDAAVWRAEARSSHDPERAVARKPPLSPAAGAGWDPERPRPLRLLRPPEPIEAMAPVPDDPPVFFRWRGALHRVRRAEGPERLAEEWWRRPFAEAGTGHARDYYRVEDELGGRFWLFRDGLYQAKTPPKWWLHGLFG